MGVIGIGFGQAVHVPAFRMAEGCSVVAIAASEQNRAERVAARLGVARALGGWRDLLAAGVDVVSIAVPPDLQADIVVAAAEQGVHVFCEKPLAASVSEARRALAAVDGRVRHAIDFEFPEFDAWRALGQTVSSGAIGRVRSLDVVWRTRPGIRRSDRAAWKGLAHRGGGLYGAFLAHLVYNAESLIGQLAYVRARESAHGGVVQGIMLECESRGGTLVRAELDTDWDDRPVHSLIVTGDAGQAELRNTSSSHGGPFVMSSGRTVVSDSDAGAGQDLRLIGVARIARRFVAAVQQGLDVRPNLSDGVRVQAVLNSIERSAREGIRVDV